MSWYHVVIDDITRLDECIEYFESEYNTAKTECKLGGSLEKVAAALPGIVEHRYSQLQEIESILEHLNIEARALHSHFFKKYLETYARQLSSRDCEKYVAGEADIVAFEQIINKFALLRNKFLSILKSLDVKQWQVTNIVKLRCAGLEDVTI